MTTGVPCCWARAMLAAPADGAALEPVGCASNRCGIGTCRHTADRGFDTQWEARLRDAFAERPDGEKLVEMILRRLQSEGLLPETPEET